MKLKLKFLLALLAAFALVVAACGNDDDDGGATSAPDGAEVDINAILAADLNNCADAPTGDPIRVGMAMDFSDVVGFVDIPGSKLVPFIAEKVNCTGGIFG
ncbi:MAG: hypothetical protein OXG66_11195, partial [Acidimicrobiaceae bacterium]|nr:hypothetical protein [Acidimicrobiaceae bacterium]